MSKAADTRAAFIDSEFLIVALKLPCEVFHALLQMSLARLCTN
jgi:hypothetical protein